MARRLGLAVAFAGVALSLAVLAGAERAGGASTEEGVPARGAAVFQARQCWSCHALDAAGSTGKSGPDIDSWLGPHAAQMRLSVEELAARRIAFGGTGMPPYVRDLSPGELADLVAFVVGRPVSIAVAGLAPLRAAPAPPPETNAYSGHDQAVGRAQGPARRRRPRGGRVRTSGLPRAVTATSARVARASAGPPLSNGGPTVRSVAATVAYLRSPAARGNPAMPGYADLGAGNLRAIAEFLAASRRRPS